MSSELFDAFLLIIVQGPLGEFGLAVLSAVLTTDSGSHNNLPGSTLYENS